MKKAFTLIELIIFIGIIGLLILIFALTVNSQKAQIRDLKRINDVDSLRNAMQVMKTSTGSFLRASCELGMVSTCSRQPNSDLTTYLPSLYNLNDPKFSGNICDSSRACQEDGCNYTFTILADDDYSVLFHLEKGVAPYTEPGCYQLTSQGIRKIQ
jgi:type II secretory pathway pseudopilin PulG